MRSSWFLWALCVKSFAFTRERHSPQMARRTQRKTQRRKKGSSRYAGLEWGDFRRAHHKRNCHPLNHERQASQCVCVGFPRLQVANGYALNCPDWCELCQSIDCRRIAVRTAPYRRSMCGRLAKRENRRPRNRCSPQPASTCRPRSCPCHPSSRPRARSFVRMLALNGIPKPSAQTRN